MTRLLGIPLGLQAGQLLARIGKFGLQLLQTLLRRGILGFLQLHLLHLKTRHAALQLIDLLGLRIKLHTQMRGRLIHQINRLIRQLTTGNITIRQRGGSHQRIVTDRHLVMSLIPLLQTTQDGDRVLNARLAHEHLLETTLKRRILLDVLAIFVQSGRADQAQLATGQHGLEHIARIHRPLGGAGTHDGMDLVDEGDDLTVGALDLLEHALQTLLELATVFGTGNHGTQIKRNELFALQGGGHIASHNTLSKPFNHGGLADTRLADQHRVVLGAAGQDLNHTTNLGIAADHRIELAFLRPGGQIGGVFLQRLVASLGIRAGDLLASAHARDGLAQSLGSHAILPEDIGGLVGRGRHHANQQMLGGDILVAHRLHFPLGRRQRRGELAARLRLRRSRPGRARQRDQSIAHRRTDPLRIASGSLNQAANHALLLAKQRVHHMQRLNLRIASGRRTLNGVADGLLRHRRELLFHIVLLCHMRFRTARLSDPAAHSVVV